MFRKRSTRARIWRLVIGSLVIIGLIWLVPWLTLSSPVDTPKVETSKDQPEQAAINDQPEQETISAQARDEKAPKDTPPPKEEGASDNLLPSSPLSQPPSSPPPAQPSLPSLPSSSPPKGEEVPKSVFSSNDYWDYGSNYWDYEPGYWDYWLDY
ncbi:MAG: hypothetical protein M3315_15145 [Actinomycetota bacterium]|nr:hypothetical protein [Actinomycetota bacterium]